MKQGIWLAITLLSMSSVSMADQSPPTTCPNIALNVGWNYADHIYRDVWEIGQKNHKYDTDHFWTAKIEVYANSEAEAYEQASRHIVEAGLLAGPVEEHDKKGGTYWKCLYMYSEGFANAITPAYLG